MFVTSLCETCRLMREVISGKGSRFVLCTLAQSRPDYPKYPPQPVRRCGEYQCRLGTGPGAESAPAQ